MIERVRIPQLSANIEEVAITAWLKEEGTRLRKGDPFVELTTDKASIEYEAPCGGVLRRILAPPKSLLPVGYIFALIGKPSDALPDVSAENDALVARHRQAGGAHAGHRRGRPAKRARVRATPAARRLARELGVDLSTIALPPDTEVISEQLVRRHGESTP